VAPLDQLFLWLERRNQPIHVGGLLLLKPPPETDDSYLSRVVDIARRATSAHPPFNRMLTRRLGAWFWIEDSAFDVDAHLRVLALPSPGRIADLHALVSQLHANLLDRAKPLWEWYVIDGVEGGRLAIYVKVHHAMVDGVAAMRMLQRALSADPQAQACAPLWAQSRNQRNGRIDAAGRLAHVASQQAASLPRVGAELARTGLANWRRDPDYVSVFHAPRCILNQRVSASRRFIARTWPLQRIRAAGKRLDGTLNDAVLAMCAAALRQYLLSLDALPEKPLIAMVPMSLRRDDSDSGNQVAMFLANLATDVAAPRQRFATIRRTVAVSKARYGSMTQTEIMNYLAAVMTIGGLNLATGLVPGRQPFNVVISNVPGPKQPLYHEGARLEEMAPVSIVLDGQALNISLASYDGDLTFGIIACRRSLPGIGRLLDGLECGLAELEQA
ncbi:MAG: wax ester/triacylglycerol synthase family O-acyltransferase, partial [Salinisphaera sp.]|nr:wax ester/triacylglycerol synthase family O-acyltransferase [Salinisphaera sp.]